MGAPTGGAMVNLIFAIDGVVTPKIGVEVTSPRFDRTQHGRFLAKPFGDSTSDESLGFSGQSGTMFPCHFGPFSF
jgi:hypothetical protein